jgi:hypothetical protein
MSKPQGSSAIAKILAKAKDFFVPSAAQRILWLRPKGSFGKSFSLIGVRL